MARWSPTCIQARRGRKCLCVRVPTDLVEAFGRTEIIRALGTGDCVRARIVAGRIMLRLRRLWYMVRDAGGIPVRQLQELAHTCLRREIEREWALLESGDFARQLQHPDMPRDEARAEDRRAHRRRRAAPAGGGGGSRIPGSRLHAHAGQCRGSPGRCSSRRCGVTSWCSTSRVVPWSALLAACTDRQCRWSRNRSKSGTARSGAGMAGRGSTRSDGDGVMAVDDKNRPHASATVPVSRISDARHDLPPNRHDAHVTTTVTGCPPGRPGRAARRCGAASGGVSP